MTASHARRRGLLERAMDGLRDALDRTVAAEATAARAGLIQRLDPRVKLAAVLSLVAAVALARDARALASLLALAVGLAIASRLPFRSLLSGAWAGTLGLTAALALPALVLTPGRAVARIPGLAWPITAQGLTTAGYLALRAESTATLALVLVFTTRWTRVLKALRAFRVPVLFVAVLGMTYRYVLMLLETAHDMFVARRSRTVGRLPAAERRRLAAQGAGALLVKALDTSGEVFLAMQARGFRGEVRVLDDFRMRRAYWIALASAVAVAALAVWIGR